MPRLPTTILSQYELENQYSIIGSQLEVKLNNPLNCPLRIWIKSSDHSLQEYFDAHNPFVLGPLSDSILRVNDLNKKQVQLEFASRFGDTTRQVISPKVVLPFPKGKSYHIVQGNNSLPSHNSEASRYAIDFSLKTGDTICAATSGIVVGVIEGYAKHGLDPVWSPFANSITIYEPETGLFTQYVHLDYMGSFVNVGDEVKQEVPIGISGMTGYTSVEHLHFNCLIPAHSEHGLKSIPIEFLEGYKGVDLKRKDRLTK